MVEWKKLILVSNVQYGFPFDSTLFTEDENYIPLIRIRDIKPAKASTYYSGDYLDEYIIRKGDILVGMDGEFNLEKWNDRDGLLNQRVLKISGKQDICLDGYIYHYMGPVFKEIEKKTAGGSVKHLSAKVVNSIQIPIPSKSEQERIVSILDTFTSSIANLKEQIKERRKQYEHYRDQLLNSVVEKQSLRDLSIKSYTGATPLKSRNDYYENGTIPWLRTQEVCFNEILSTDCFITEEALNKTSVKWIPANCVIVAISGATAGRCAINKIPLTTNQHCLCLEIKETKALYKFVYYCICKQNDELIGKKEGARGDLNSSKILSLQVPCPSLQEQSRIVSILDQFEASIANLEAQLKEREKQYKYYRNQLLTFE